jgi:hypothetical protein
MRGRQLELPVCVPELCGRACEVAGRLSSSGTAGLLLIAAFVLDDRLVV